MTSKQEILTYLTINKTEFYQKYGIQQIGVFGSFARDEQREDSDIDILIKMAPETEGIFEKRLALRELLMNHFMRKVDICHEQTIKPIFRDILLNEVVYA